MKKYELESIPENPGVDLVHIYKMPRPETLYSIGVDAATGVLADYTSLQVFSHRVPYEQVAWFHSNRTSTVEGSRIMVELGYFFNEAMLVIETRYPGNAYQDNALEKYMYPNLYSEETHLQQDIKYSKIFGIMTTEQSKALLINETKTLIEHKNYKGVYVPQIIFHDPFTLQSFTDYVYLEDKSKSGAISGCIDDPVMATMLAVRGCNQKPQEAEKRGEPIRMTEDQAHKSYLLKRHFSKIRQGVVV
ncbi:hypothetical protein LCGC14_0844570 [marine sediment metagenome]|uniref:Uncharacterized protein n=1 Tax=marine sediment metagenome TaxID=412755 RepID=A0A0F9SJ72_9ZZZZ